LSAAISIICDGLFKYFLNLRKHATCQKYKIRTNEQLHRFNSQYLLDALEVKKQA